MGVAGDCQSSTGKQLRYCAIARQIRRLERGRLLESRPDVTQSSARGLSLGIHDKRGAWPQYSKPDGQEPVAEDGMHMSPTCA